MKAMSSKIGTAGSWRRLSRFPLSGVFGREGRLWGRIFVRKGQELLTVDNLLFVTAALLLGRANILGELAPFGLVFWALVSRYNPEKRRLAAVMVVAGRATVFSGWSFFSLPAGMIIVSLLEKALERTLRREFPLYLLVPAAIFITYLPLAVYTYFTVYETVVVVLEVSVAALTSVLLAPAAVHILERPGAGVKQEEMIGSLLFFLLMLLGLGSFTVAGLVSVRNVLCKLFLILGAFLFGPGWGAATGLLMGIVVSINDPRVVFLVSALTAAGFLAGFLRQFNRAGSMFGFLLASQLFSLYMAPEASLFAYLREDLLVSLLFLLMPWWFMEKLRHYQQPFLLLESGVREEELRRFTAQRIIDFADVFQELSRTFKSNSLLAGTAAQQDISPLLGSLAGRVCRSCPMWKRCWEREFYRHSRQIIDLFARAEYGKRIKKEDIPDGLKKRCPRTFELVNQINDMLDIYKVNRYWQKKVLEGRDLVSIQLKGISQVMHDLAREIKLELELGGEEPPFPAKSNLFSLEAGIAQRPCAGEDVSGDCYAFLQLKDGKHVIILSDGMGKGKRAYLESKATVSLIENLLKTGFKKELVLRTVNSLLQLRSSEETFATVDMAFFDLTEGEIEFLKIGAVPSYLKRDGSVAEFGAISLPLGILQDIDPQVIREQLEDRDLLVMVSDGIVDFKSTSSRSWLKETLKEVKHSHPQIVADFLLEEAGRRWSSALEDDITVIVCRVRRLRHKFNSFV